MFNRDRGGKLFEKQWEFLLHLSSFNKIFEMKNTLFKTGVWNYKKACLVNPLYHRWTILSIL